MSSIISQILLRFYSFRTLSVFSDAKRILSQMFALVKNFFQFFLSFSFEFSVRLSRREEHSIMLKSVCQELFSSFLKTSFALLFGFLRSVRDSLPIIAHGFLFVKNFFPNLHFLFSCANIPLLFTTNSIKEQYNAYQDS